HAVWNRIRVLAVVGVLLGLGGCAGMPGAPAPSPSPAAWLLERITALDGVLSADASADDEYLTVVIAQEADDEAVLAAARASAALAEEGVWPGRVTLVRATGGPDPATDVTPLAPWTQEVYPGDPDEAEATLTLLLALEKVPDVAGVHIAADGWPTVQLSSLDTFAATFRTLSALPAFADGGTYSYAGEQPRLHIVHLPERMSAESIEAVIRIAVENPESEVELQSLTTPGNRWPELWVARLTDEQRVRVDAQLRDPALADADPEGYSIPFQLSVLGPNGPELSWGTFGDVPDTSS
ncbi:hypothetical protein, partial [Pseudolysinimonas sp.]|uniref:hypothetical protein n=1 Tax=Pseudolysinimonas sp. TaxID=2680009 RepID=UPI0037850CAD